MVDRAVPGPMHIDQVEDLGEWKTAWDHVRFDGSLGTRMTLQLTWEGCDSALAAPLVLDLATGPGGGRAPRTGRVDADTAGSVANGAATSVGAEVRQNLWAGPDGAYTLTFDVLSSDGHEMAGEIHFEVGAGASAEVRAAATSESEGDSDGTLRGVVVPGAVVPAVPRLRAGHPAAPRGPGTDLIGGPT